MPAKAGMTAEVSDEMTPHYLKCKSGDKAMDDQSETIALILEIRTEMHERFDQSNVRLHGLSVAIEARTREIEIQTEAVMKRLSASRAAALQLSLKGTEVR